MIKIMIVDDMPIFREYLRGCIDWNAYGFEICCEAEDGKEALDKIERYYPDIILTDITMPYMDGLELSEVVMQRYPDISIVLITGNSEFEYARRAVKIGVCDYIVKPFEKEELLLSLLKLQDNIGKAIEIKNDMEELELQKKEMGLRKLILSSQSGEEARKQLKRVGISFESEYFLVCTMRFLVDNLSELDQIHNWEKVIVDMLRDKMEIVGSYQIFRDYENGIVLILNFDNEEEMKDYKVYELTDIHKIIKSQLQLETLIGVSDYCYGLEQVKAGYVQAMHVLKDKDTSHAGKVWDYKKIDFTEEDIYYSWEMVEQLQKALEQLNEELAEETIRTEFQHIKNSPDANLRLVFHSRIIGILLTNIVNSGRNIEAVFGENFRPYHVLKRLPSAEAQEDMVISYFKKVISYEKQNSNKKSREVTERAKAYIQQHYMEADLNIADISKELLMNQTYLRKMFKSEMNQTLSEYITKYRMNIARKLIQETDDKLSVIAERTGYSDVSYFSKCFKRYYGTSPKNIAQK